MLFAFLAACACGCGAVHNGPIINARGHEDAIRDSLAFLEEREPPVHALVVSQVKKITWKGDPFWSLTVYPDHVILSTNSMKRGTIYLSSLLYHELNHIMIRKLRDGRLRPDEDKAIREHYRLREKVSPDSLISLSRYEEEKLIHELQLKFLIRHGDGENAELQKLNIRQLDATYRHLPR